MTAFKAMLLGFSVFLMGCDDGPPSIHKWQGVVEDTGTYIYIVRNPPKTQSGLVSLITDYIKHDPNTPANFWDDSHSISFYKESDATPIDGNRPEASWWEQPMTDPAIKYKEIDDKEIAGVRYLKDKDALRIYLYLEYRKTCKDRQSGIVEVQADGTTEPLCD